MYVKARYKNQKRAYTFQTPDDVIPGDVMVNEKGSKLVIVSDPVDEKWIAAYGADKLSVIRKLVEEC